MSVVLHFWRFGSQTSKEFPTVTEAIAAALEWKYAERKWGIAYAIWKGGSNLFPEREEPEEWAAEWDRLAEIGEQREQHLDEEREEREGPDY